VIYDDIVLGSGLSALATLLGLGDRRRIAMLAGPATGTHSYYTSQRVVPCAFVGYGGLGNFWHGVIPTSMAANFGDASSEEYAAMFARFYPHAALQDYLGKPHFFVPWKPIRPPHELTRLRRGRGERLHLIGQSALRFVQNANTVEAVATDGSRFVGRHLWIACGSLHTPALLEQSLGKSVSRGYASDHVVSYIGQVRGVPAPSIRRTRDGIFFPVKYATGNASAYSMRPARFAFRKLDFGIEQRAVFGMPTGNAVRKILRRLSPGLLAEALYNRAGLFPKATDYSVYAQTLVSDTYELGSGPLPLRARTDAIQQAAVAAADHAPFANLLRTQRSDLYIPGIHLHNTIDAGALESTGIDNPASNIQIVDASVLRHIGADHHSFKVMMLAYRRARAVTDAER
jgi:hypothetical protein